MTTTQFCLQGKAVLRKTALTGCKVGTQRGPFAAMLHFFKNVPSFVIAGFLVTSLALSTSPISKVHTQVSQQNNSLVADHDAELKPVTDCVIEMDLVFIAYFGYKNGHDRNLSIEIGTDNHFWPDPIDRGQPTEFLEGQHHKVFTVQFDKNSSISWYLNGRTAVASSNSQRCQSPTPTLPTPTVPGTNTVTPTVPVTETSTPTAPVTETTTPTVPITETSTPTAPATETNTPTLPATDTPTPTASVVTETPTPTLSATYTATPTVPATDTPTSTLPATDTSTPTAPITESPTPTTPVTETATPTVPATHTPTPTVLTTETPTPTVPVTKSPTPTVFVTDTSTPTAPVTETPMPTKPATDAPTPTAPVTETPTPTVQVTETPTVSAAKTPTPTMPQPVWIICPVAPSYSSGVLTPTPSSASKAENANSDSEQQNVQDERSTKLIVTVLDLLLAISAFLMLSFFLNHNNV